MRSPRGEPFFRHLFIINEEIYADIVSGSVHSKRIITHRLHHPLRLRRRRNPLGPLYRERGSLRTVQSFCACEQDLRTVFHYWYWHPVTTHTGKLGSVKTGIH